ncbi:Error-prone DNA polymerase [Methylobrevis pamukkalensis]|uniref:Error-prone DNA polymerase n=1 Tax=Methylobrevis pamukkalensis TaxID=1439726 RepID=A0A1E3H608_9HYPH|nr:Error-prone DNA polymerase [Methylobrevis pamukkalensis]
MYAELQVTTNFSFLRGASHPDELFRHAAALGIPALGVCDRNTLAGLVRAFVAAQESGVRLVAGCRLDLEDGCSILVYPQDRPAYSRLCRLLTLGKGRAGKGRCRLTFADLADHAAGMTAILLPDAPDAALGARLAPFADVFGEDAHLALTLRRRPGDADRLEALSAMARGARVAPVATNDVLYHEPRRRILQDVVTAIREHVTIDEAGFRKTRFADRHLKPPAEMARLFAAHPEAVERSMAIVGRCRFSLADLRYQYPNEVSMPGVTPQQELVRLTWEGAAQRYPQGLPAKTRRLLAHELGLIEQLGYAPYFLTVNAIVRFARSRGILCQGRGSAANSAVCYVLGITSIDPEHNNLLFERFVSTARKEPPDIDVDFEHERREEVIQWIYGTYGRDRAALTATVIRYRTRGALRDVGKAMGLPEDVTAALSGQVWGWSMDGVPEQAAATAGLDIADRRLRLTLELTRELTGFPRHLSQHPGGFVLTDDRLDDLVPIEPAAMENRQVIEWDKDDIDALKFMKVDVLGLGMLGCMRRASISCARRRA